ncbi:MAG TPA: hypothetical protein VHG09_12965 [Longimicrobiales bacterium]|nr:hypothetical protein [Longimicrobiales bacterium]
MRLTMLIPALMLPLIAIPSDAEAQRRHDRWGSSNPWSFSPYAGLFKDAFDISPDDENTGWMAGFRIGYDIGDRTRLLGDIGYAESDDVTSGPLVAGRNVYDNQYILTTGGAEYDILPGNTSVSIGTLLGGAWRKVVLDEDAGDTVVPEFGDGYSFYFAVVPALTVRHGFSSRTALEVSVRDYIFPDGTVDHMPALNVGFRFR